MIKKRRQISDEWTLVCKDQHSIPELLGNLISERHCNDCLVSSFKIKEEYGVGEIQQIAIDDITLILNSFELRKDILFRRNIQKDFVQLSFLLNGEKIICLKGNEIFLEGSDSYLAQIKPLDGTFKILANCPYQEVRIRLTNSFLGNHGFTDDYRFNELLSEHSILPITDKVMEVLDTIINYNFYEPTAKMYLTAKVFELLALQITNYKNGVPTKTKIKGAQNLKRLSTVKKVIVENLQTNYSLSYFSKEIGMNKTHLNREFSRIFGLTINQFSLEQKMNRAKYLLHHTDVPIYEIAEEVGYKNSTHFSAAFKREVGKTPRQFRIFD